MDPPFDIGFAVEDSAAELDERRTASGNAVPFERSDGNAEQVCDLFLRKKSLHCSSPFHIWSRKRPDWQSVRIVPIRSDARRCESTIVHVRRADFSRLSSERRALAGAQIGRRQRGGGSSALPV
jgi:hypothetical protein